MTPLTATARRSSILSIKRLTIAFRHPAGFRPAVEDLSLELRTGETMGVVGESGSGKSVTALAILRLLPEGPGVRLSGSIRLGGSDILSLPEKEMCRLRGRRAAIVFQEPMTSLNPLMTVGRQVAEAVACHHQRSRSAVRDGVHTLLAEVGLPDPVAVAPRYPHELSGGQQQRILIAMALAGDPDLLIADEPTTALDVTIQAQILQLLRRIQQLRHMAMLFISHDLAVVAAVADRVAVMRSGRIVEDRLTEELFRRPRHPYTRTLLASRAGLGGSVGADGPAGGAFPGRPGSPHDFAQLSHPNRPLFAPGNGNAERPLAVHDLAITYRGRRGAAVCAVERVSLEVRPGEAFGLVGESGSGKSSLAKAVVGLVRPEAGTIRLFGRDVEELRPMQRSRLCQMIFQDAAGALNPRLRILTILSEPYEIHHPGSPAEIRAWCEGLLDEVGLGPEHLSRYPHELSGGQRQRVCIARALAVDPGLLVCDEPVSALDVTTQAQVLDLLKGLQRRRGMSLLFIGHDLVMVQAVCERIAVMKDGRIVEQGTARAVLTMPTHPYTQALVAAVPRLDILLPELSFPAGLADPAWQAAAVGAL